MVDNNPDAAVDEANSIDALIAQGAAARDSGNWPVAIASFRHAIERDGKNAMLFFHLGTAYAAAGDFANAIHAFERAVAIDPDYFASYRAAADAAVGQSGKAAAVGDTKAARDLKKFAAMYLLALGKRQTKQRVPDAGASLRDAVALDPKNAEAFWALGAFLESTGLSSEAEKPLRRAIALDPRMAHAYVSLGNTFQSRGRFAEMEAAYRKAVALDPSLQAVRESLATIPLMSRLYDDKATPAMIHTAHRSWGDAVVAEMASAAAKATPFANSRDPERRLRVAYLSGDFRYHAVSFFFQPLLAHHDPHVVEVFCYSEVEVPDPATRFLQSIGGTWRNTHGVSDSDLRAALRADRIDIAIDLAGHTTGNRLRALAVKAAPVTATWLGYPATTGLGTIDWRVTDAIADPPGQEAFHTEKLMRLPAVFLCYNPYITPIPDVAPLPALAHGSITFGSFNSPLKLSPAAIAAWARILDAMPDSRLVLKSIAFVEPTQRSQFLARFSALGVGADRIELREPQPELPAHLASYGDIDIALDPFPYNGTTTTCEAMWMGVPMITLIGERHAARVGVDLLTQVGLAELAAPDVDTYVALSIGLARDLPRLTQLRGALRARLRASPICDGPRFARDFEAALRDMWGAWCRAGE